MTEFIVFTEAGDYGDLYAVHREVFAKDRQDAALQIANGITGAIGKVGQGSGTYLVCRKHELSEFEIVEDKTYVVKEQADEP